MAAEYLKRYDDNDPGLRFQDLVYTGNFTDMEPVPDGILGDRVMKSRAQTGVLEKVSHEAVLEEHFSIAELNDLNNYIAWNIWDVLVMRATEGASGMIPRQEYEILAVMHEFYRYPELIRMTTDEIGAQGVIDIGASARGEIGTKINCVHDWSLGAVAYGMGRCALLALEAIKPDDYIEESSTILKFMQRVNWGKRQDGWILNSQDRYRCQIHDDDLLERLQGEMHRFDEGDPNRDTLIQFNAAAELLSFLDHFDCRLGLGDTGPYPRSQTVICLSCGICFVTRRPITGAMSAIMRTCRIVIRWYLRLIPRRWISRRFGLTIFRRRLLARRTTFRTSPRARCSCVKNGTPRWVKSIRFPLPISRRA